MLLQSNGVNQVNSRTILFQEHEPITHICIILKGHVIAKNEGVRIELGQGCVIGTPDLFLGRYIYEYTAEEDTVIYPLSVSKPEDLNVILSNNEEHRGLIIYSLCHYIRKMNTIVEELRHQGDALYEFLTDTYTKYIHFGEESLEPFHYMPDISALEPYTDDVLIDAKLLDYYLEYEKVPAAVLKKFYGCSTAITMRHVQEAAGLITSMAMQSMELAEYVKTLFQKMINNNGPALFEYLTELFLRLRKKGYYSKDIMKLIDLIVDEINRTDLLLERDTKESVYINRERFESIYCSLVSGIEKKEQDEKPKKVNRDQIVLELKNSLEQILKYSTIDIEDKQKFTSLINEFLNLSDRMSIIEDVRKLRRSICNLFYPLYENIFHLAYEQKEVPRVIRLFLNFGYIDERLLSEEQIVSLYSLLDANRSGEGKRKLKVYSLFEWLKLIYEGKREPSKNEFDEDYTDYIRHSRKNKAMTDEQVRQCMEDMGARLHFEIQNMFTTNNKVVHGQISTFVPFLHKDIFLNYPEKELLTNEIVEDVFMKIRSIDYSAFYRESIYMNEEAHIKKETITTEVFPEIIMLPIVGSAGSMWQEISAKRRLNPGRFILPVFLDTNLYDVMVRLFGRFHWELCRCIQGTGWNDLKNKSLTSEYMDYIQFYRKNRDLTEEKKEKLKLQIQKARGNSREVFVLDYETWIKGESAGAIRLNKVVREIMATYCPFSKELREKLTAQPMFAEAYARFQRETGKKVHEVDLRLHNLGKDKIEPTKEILDTVSFYKDL